MNNNQIMIEDYILQEVLGEGQYGKVYKALNHKTNKLCAVKAVRVEKFKEVEKLEEFTMNEIQALSQIQNQHVIQFVEMLQTKHNYYFVYEYCNGGDLEHLEAKVGALQEQQAIMIYKQILMAFTSLVKANIMHRDLKPANVLFHNGQVKLADFGFCKQLNSRKDMTNTMVGSPIYMAPEILLGKDYTSAADIWSLGCVFYEMLYQQCPFEEKSISALIHAVENKEAEFPSRFNVSQKSIDILKPILVKDPTKRITWEELFQRELSQQDMLTIQPTQLMSKEHEQRRGSQQSTPSYSISRTFQYLVHERNKVIFLYTMLQEILELNFSLDVPVYCFIFVKYICKVAMHIKKNLIDSFNISAFPHLSSKFEYWNQLPESFEYKSFVKLGEQELNNMTQLQQPFTDEFQKSLSFSKYRTDLEIIKEMQSDCNNMNMSLLKKFMINYVEEIKMKYLNQIVQQPNDEHMKKWLTHSHKIIDALLIDETFENFFSVEQPDFFKQQYFITLEKYTIMDLLNIVQNKINYARNIQLK